MAARNVLGAIEPSTAHEPQGDMPCCSDCPSQVLLGTYGDRLPTETMMRRTRELDSERWPDGSGTPPISAGWGT